MISLYALLGFDTMTNVQYDEFKETIWQKGKEHYREMPWRSCTRPYFVLVSELMLQQTQVSRVEPKFLEFIHRFPDEAVLAKADLSEVLTLWSGLGYNRRAKFLHQAAIKIVHEYGGTFPDTFDGLLSLPGVGSGTAGAISAYAFNLPVVFIETNIRTVYFHHFFEDSDRVTDRQLVPLIEATLPRDHPREFYWALMDYGTWLKRQGIGNNTLSAHYKKQTPLAGSMREMRGRIVRALTSGPLERSILADKVEADDRFSGALEGLRRDGLVEIFSGVIHLTKGVV